LSALSPTQLATQLPTQLAAEVPGAKSILRMDANLGIGVLLSRVANALNKSAAIGAMLWRRCSPDGATWLRFASRLTPIAALSQQRPTARHGMFPQPTHDSGH
jgi:hypothetical protein